jgi:hypothetical protein
MAGEEILEAEEGSIVEMGWKVPSSSMKDSKIFPRDRPHLWRGASPEHYLSSNPGRISENPDGATEEQTALLWVHTTHLTEDLEHFVKRLRSTGSQD